MSVKQMTLGELVEAFHLSLHDMMEQNIFEFEGHVDAIKFPISIYNKMVHGDEVVKSRFRDFGDTYIILEELSARIGDADRGLYNKWFSLIK